MISWGFVALFALTPFNWLRLWLQGDLPPGATPLQAMAGVAICWGLAGFGGFCTLRFAQAAKRRQAREQQALAQLHEQPLAPMVPRQALLQPGEVAYAAVEADLQEVHTVGQETRTRGSSYQQVLGTGIKHYSTSTSTARNEAVIVASGELVVTSERLIFAGDRTSFAMALRSLVNVNGHSNGFVLSDGASTRTVLIHDAHQHTVFRITLQKALKAVGMR
jgi:hypothetical protein